MTIILPTRNAGVYPNTTIKPVMRRVYMIWLVRTVTQPLGRTLLGAIFLCEIFIAVSVRNVYTNAKSVQSVGDSFNFARSAFLNTDWLVQASLIGTTLIFLSLGRGLSRGVYRNLPNPFRVTRGIRLWSKA
jgi:hypothetical protein